MSADLPAHRVRPVRRPDCFLRCVVVAGLLFSPPRAFSADAAPADIGSRLELFVDHHLIAGLKDAELRLHSPVSREIVFVFDAPWERGQSGYVTLLQDGAEYRMYYRGGGDISREYTCVAFSRDGVRWERPRLGLCEFEGSKENNILWTGRHKAYCEAHNFSPFLDANPECPPEQRYKAVTSTRYREDEDLGKNVLLALVSPDGIHWQKLCPEPIITEGAFDSHNVAFWDTVHKQYVCFLRAGRDGRRSIARATSPDFLQWTTPQLLDFGDSPAEHLYTNGILPYCRATHIYLGFPGRFIAPQQRHTVGVDQRPTDGFSDAVFMSSRDGLHWDRTFMEAFIRPGPDPLNWGGAHGNTFPAWGLLPCADQTLSIYWMDHYDNYPSMTTIPRVWRGTVRTDGFTSVGFPYRGGELVTKPLVFAGRNLVINYATSAAGSVRVEIQDAGGVPLPGFSADDCLEFWGDEVERLVAWKYGSDVSPLAGRPVRLRFALRDADLYAFRFRP